MKKYLRLFFYDLNYAGMTMTQDINSYTREKVQVFIPFYIVKIDPFPFNKGYSSFSVSGKDKLRIFPLPEASVLLHFQVEILGDNLCPHSFICKDLQENAVRDISVNNVNFLHPSF